MTKNADMSDLLRDPEIRSLIDAFDIMQLIEAAEPRATCKMGMDKTRSRFLVILAPEDAKALGVCGGSLNLHVQARRGTVDLIYAGTDGSYRECSNEPSEPELQELVVKAARRSPVGAALELLRIDLERRAEHQGWSDASRRKMDAVPDPVDGPKPAASTFPADWDLRDTRWHRPD